MSAVDKSGNPDPSSRFKPMLAKLERDLEIPYPRKRELIDELSSHLADLYDEIVDEGFGPQEAIRRAVSAMALDREFIDSIDEVHRPLVARALAKLPPRVALGVEYTVIGLLAAVIVVTIFFQEETMLEVLLEGGIFMIPIGLMGLAVLVLSVERTYSLFIKKDHSRENVDRRLLSLKFLGSACVLTGVVGTMVGLFQAFSSSAEIATKFGSFPIFEVARIAMTTSIAGTVVALFALCAFYLFEAKASRIRGMQIA